MTAWTTVPRTAPTPGFEARLPDLAAELEGALLDAMGGDPWGPALKGRLMTVARHVLLRHGEARARVEVGYGSRGVEVTVLLPPGPARVRRLVETVGGASGA